MTEEHTHTWTKKAGYKHYANSAGWEPINYYKCKVCGIGKEYITRKGPTSGSKKDLLEAFEGFDESGGFYCYPETYYGCDSVTMEIDGYVYISPERVKELEASAKEHSRDVRIQTNKVKEDKLAAARALLAEAGEL